MTQEIEDVVGNLQRLLAGFAGENDLKVGPHMLAHGIEEALAKVQSLSDRIDVLARERDHWKAECKALCDVVSEHTKARAALHQERIKEGSDAK